jgi:uncharacterized surface protein with fasciclin (FAS1) repeats
MKRLTISVLLIPILILFTACEDNMMDANRDSADIQARAAASSNVMERAVPAPSDVTIADIVISFAGAEDEQFTQLLDALIYTELAGVFTGGEQFTVFAPVDDAFYALYEILGVDSIRDLDVELVTDVLLYHVAEGRRASNSVVPPRRDRNIQTLLGVSFQVTPDAEINAIGNTAGFVSADLLNISASNGIIHVIDTVLLPIEI